MTTCGRPGEDARPHVDRMTGEDCLSIDALFACLYDHLRREAHRQINREGAANTIQATELIGEAYLRLQSVRGRDLRDEHHARRLVARTMRHVLVDCARKRLSKKRGGDLERVTLVTSQGVTTAPGIDILAVHTALEDMECGSGNLPRAAAVMELRFFAGAEFTDIALALQISERQAYRDYRYASAWLRRKLNERDDTAPHGASPML